jgi:hypothetical protein
MVASSSAHRAVRLVCSTLLVTVVGVSGCGATSPGGPGPGPGDGSSPTAADTVNWGFTHTEESADTGDPAASQRVASELAGHPMMQAQALMGWGVDNPEPSPGQFDWSSLDRRIQFIRRSGGTPVVTLCGAPDWMKGGKAGQTNWKTLEDAPQPAHYGDFAQLAAAVARRYPDVHYFLVWNEFKGFFNDSTKTWDGPAYTTMYNDVYGALKAVNPALKVGGPYLDMGVGTDAPSPSPLAGPWGSVDPRTLQAFDYWNAHKSGADFVVVDGHATTAEGASDDVTALGKFAAVSQWVHQRTSLPLWWAEWYVEPNKAGWSGDKEVAMRTAAMMQFAHSGVAAALYWNAEDTDDAATELWSPTDSASGGQPGPFLGVLEQFTRWFPPGSRFGELAVPPGVQALTTDQMALLVNTSDQPAQVMVDGKVVALAPWAVQWTAREPS